MTLTREKRGHFNQLRAASHLEADLALLKSIDSNHKLLSQPSGKEQKYADDVLYELLLKTTSCDIIAYRRKFAKEKLQKSQSDILKKRFEEFLKKSNPEKAVDIEKLIKVISAGLFLLVTTLDWPVNEDVFPSEIALVPVDAEKYNVILTAEAVADREAARLKKEQDKAAELKKQQDEAAAVAREAVGLMKKQEEEAAAELEKASQLQEKEEELDEKESELSDKESELEDKEFELSQKEDQLDVKEAELAVKESDLKEKAVVEKKSASKKTNTQK